MVKKGIEMGYSASTLDYYGHINKAYHMRTLFLWCPANALIFGIFSSIVWGDFFSGWTMLPIALCILIRVVRYVPLKEPSISLE